MLEKIVYSDEEVQKIIRSGPPFYFLKGPVIINESVDGFHVVGKAYFSSEDDSSLEERDHVNVSHYFHAFWNIARLLEPLEGTTQSRVLDQSSSYRKDGVPDTPYFIRATLKRLDHKLGEKTLFSLRGQISDDEKFEGKYLVDQRLTGVTYNP